MKTLYVIQDLIAKEWLGMQMYILFAFRNDTQAIRYFTDITDDDTTLVHKHVEDYQLLAVAEINEKEEGQVVLAYEQPRVVITGQALISLRSKLTGDIPNNAHTKVA